MINNQSCMIMNNTNDRKIAVIGAGIAGLTAAFRLTQKGFKVKLFESLDKLGGLARTISIEGEPVEVFYHHFFSTDDFFLKICKELGINDKVRWLKAKMGYFSDGEIFDFGTPASLLQFKPLSLKDKIRFGLSVLKIMKEKSLEEISQYTAEDWLIKNAGQKVFDIVWKPLLIQKFGGVYKEVSMAWLWRKVQTRSLSKKNIFGKERLAYLDGSIEILINKLKDRIIQFSGQIALSEKVNKINVKDEGRYTITTNDLSEDFDIIVSTVAPEILNSLLSFPDEFNLSLQKLKQIGVIGILLVLSKKLTDYYWLNIGDNSFPFGLLVEHTNFCKPEKYKGKHIVYLSKYLDKIDSLFSEFREGEVKSLFLKHLNRINKNFQNNWIEDVFVFTESFAQPIVGTNYIKIKPNYSTTLPNFYWVSANHIYPDDRGINYSIKMAEEVVELICR